METVSLSEKRLAKDTELHLPVSVLTLNMPDTDSQRGLTNTLAGSSEKQGPLHKRTHLHCWQQLLTLTYEWVFRSNHEASHWSFDTWKRPLGYICLHAHLPTGEDAQMTHPLTGVLHTSKTKKRLHLETADFLLCNSCPKSYPWYLIQNMFLLFV